MTNLNVRFFSHFILGTYLVDIKLITSHFLPIFTLINIRTRGKRLRDATIVVQTRVFSFVIKKR